MIRSWTFQNKVTAGFAVMVALAVLTAAITVYSLRAVVASTDALIANNTQELIGAARMDAAMDRQAAGFRGFVALPEDRFLREKERAQQEYAEVFHRLQAIGRSEEGKRLLAEVDRQRAALTGLEDRAIAMRTRAGGLETAVRLMQEEILPAHDQLVMATDAFLQLAERRLAEAQALTAHNTSLASIWLVCLAAATVLFAAVTALLLGRALSRQIGSAIQHVQSSSTELQTSANQQAVGAKETATAMSEVSSTMNELLVTSRQIAESAQQVARIAEETAGAARTGDQTVAASQEAIEGIRRQVNLIVGHMLELGKKSQQIGSVLDVINELAEQTNILSINATIEAAGAGEQGKRFAVVGDEIRKLADRVAGSSREIRALVEEIRGAVHTTVLATETGSKAVDAGLNHFEEVTRGFKQIAGLVVTTTQAAREIELSTKQQTSAVEQVNSAIGGAAQASRENEVSSSQTLQTATQLVRLSHNLSLIVARASA
jgi:methyl-accepting chemotaxis protein